MKSRLADADFETIVSMRERGCSYEKIARRVGISKGAVSWHCLRLAVDPPKPHKLRPDYHLHCPALKRGNHIVRAFTPDEDAVLLRMEGEGARLSQIGRALSRQPNSIKGRLMTLARREERGIAA